VWEIKELVGETPLVFDWEFSAQRWLEALEEAGCEWMVRLNTNERGEDYRRAAAGGGDPLGDRKRREAPDGGGLPPPRAGVKVNVSGIWPKDQREPLWVMGSLKPDRLVEVYEERMKIEQTFKDSKSLLDMEKVMNNEAGASGDHAGCGAFGAWAEANDRGSGAR